MNKGRHKMNSFVYSSIFIWLYFMPKSGLAYNHKKEKKKKESKFCEKAFPFLPATEIFCNLSFMEYLLNAIKTILVRDIKKFFFFPFYFFLDKPFY